MYISFKNVLFNTYSQLRFTG